MQYETPCQLCKNGTVVLENQHLICTNKACFYTERSPVTFENDINAYDAEDRVMNRFSQIYTPHEATGQNQRFQTESFQNNYFKGKKYIFDCGYALKISQNICGEALSMLFTVLKAIETQKRLTNGAVDVEASKDSQSTDLQYTEKKKKGKNQRYKNKNIFGMKFLCAYSLQAVCFQRENYFQQYNIIKQLQVSMKEWRDVNKQMNSLLRSYLSFVPMIQPKHIVIKVCKKRHINNEEKQVMIEMCERIAKYSTADVRTHTIAAIAFWKICQFSMRYRSRIDLRHICKSHDRLIEKGLQNQTYGFFDITPQNVRKVYKEYIKPDFQSRYLPQWPGRVPLPFDSKGNLQDYD